MQGATLSLVGGCFISINVFQQPLVLVFARVRVRFRADSTNVFAKRYFLVLWSGRACVGVLVRMKATKSVHMVLFFLLVSLSRTTHLFCASCVHYPQQLPYRDGAMECYI